MRKLILAALIAALAMPVSISFSTTAEARNNCNAECRHYKNMAKIHRNNARGRYKNADNLQRDINNANKKYWKAIEREAEQQQRDDANFARKTRKLEEKYVLKAYEEQLKRRLGGNTSRYEDDDDSDHDDYNGRDNVNPFTGTNYRCDEILTTPTKDDEGYIVDAGAMTCLRNDVPIALAYSNGVIRDLRDD